MQMRQSPYQAPFVPNDQTVHWVHQSELPHDSHVHKYDWYRSDVMYQIASNKNIPVHGLSSLVSELNQITF